MSASDYILVGSGINSLVCGAMLAGRGKRVLILERNDRPGGCIRTGEITVPGFIHDVFSCWHPLFVTSPAYALLKTDLERHGLEYCCAELATGILRPDGDSLVLRRSRLDNANAINALCAGDGDRYGAAMAEFERSFDLTASLLGSDVWSWSLAGTVLGALRRQGLRGLAAYGAYSLESARSWLEDTFESEIVRACFAPWTLHAGMGPDAPGSAQMARIIPFTLEAVGSPVVKGGGYNLVQAFQRLIEERGGEVRVNVDVRRVLVRGRRARGVVSTSGEEFHARSGVICSVTPGQLYGKLLEGAAVPGYIRERGRRFRHGRADMQIHVALDHPPRWPAEELGHVPLLHLTSGLDGVSRAVNAAQRGLLPAAPTVAVGQPLAADSSRAPAGKGMLWIQILELPSHIKADEAGSIDVPADGRWSGSVRDAFADRVMDRIGQLVPGLGESILGRSVWSPADLEASNCNLVGGDPYGGACDPDQLLWWRPLRGLRSYTTPLRDLYHIGASTHPGPGLAGGSGYNLACRL